MELKVQRRFAPWWRVIQPIALVVIVILFIISLPQLLFMAVIALLATPFALLELIVLGVVGSRPCQVEVIGHTERKVHSLTTPRTCQRMCPSGHTRRLDSLLPPVFV